MRTGLHGVQVLELGRVLAAPYCGMLLADLGADVIKVEAPAGDDLRSWAPPNAPGGGSTYFEAANRNKRSICIDLKRPGATPVLHRLVAASDVLIDNFRPGVLERLGLSDEEIARVNPRLVHCTVTAFGDAGPLASAPGYDIILQAMSGLMSVTGPTDGEPMRVGVAVIDVLTGTFAAAGILAALVEAQRTQRGGRVQTSLLECALAAMPNLTAGWLQAGAIPQRLGNAHGNAAPYGVFRVRDGWIVLAVGNDVQWARLVETLGRPELAADPRYATNAARVERRAELNALVEALCGDRDRDQTVAALSAADIAAGPINTVPEVLDSLQVAALGAVSCAGAPDRPSVNGAPARLVDAPFRPHSDTYRPAPRLGEHSDEVLRQLLDCSFDEVQHLRASEVLP